MNNDIHNLENSEKEKLKLQNAIEDTLDKLEKASFILEHWVGEYLFAEKPDPRAAIEHMSRVKKSDIHKEQSFKWFFEYNRISQFIRIVNDYVYESKKLLEDSKS